MSYQRPWTGVRWIDPVGGVCPKHKQAVGQVTGLCALCHREQLEAAADGSYEWDDAGVGLWVKEDE